MSHYHTYSGAGVLIIDGDSIILLQDFHGKFDLPGGKIDRGETPERAASRELEEETRKVYLLRDYQVRQLPSLDIPTGDPNRPRDFFKVYVLKTSYTPGICTRFNTTDVRYMPPQYRETLGMQRFPVANAKAIFRSNPAPTHLPGETRSGQMQNKEISGRCRRVIRTAIQMGYF